MISIEEIIQKALETNASDVHISVDSELLFRICGQLTKVTQDKLNEETVMAIINPMLSEKHRKEFEKIGESDFAISLGGTRSRVNVFHQQGLPACSLRILPSKILTVNELKIPQKIIELCNNKKGLVLVTGPTGSGKSTTLAAMINYINENMNRHIITMEDPIEYVHESKKSFIQHREVGSDTKSFAAGIRASLREDPDVLLIGEMRDPETMEIALTAAETGHLVFSTLHANNAPSTIDRIIDAFQANKQDQIRTQMTGVLLASIAQMLVPAKDGGRVATYELMLMSDAVKNHIREGKTQLLYADIDQGRQIGMCTLDDSFIDLYKRKMITKEILEEYIVDKNKLLKINDEW